MTDNLRIWSKVEKTNPAHTKHVNQRGGFTAVSANYQILAATELFGPIGEGWGYTTDTPVIVDTLVMIPVTLWHGNRENSFGPMWGCEEWKDAKGRIDSDAPKKATTDGLTKLLSQLGFNADVFLGKFDDQKYVEQMRREFAAVTEPDPMSPITDKTRDWLQAQIDAAPVQVGDVCRAFEVSSLKQLTFGQVREVTDWIKQKKAA
ncbi:hypothetical protein [Novosphingobium sp. JCM 18896]|uniref:hypothetical protein n=1 Tax=Novosphingobium sp. JCM 18896 TaxID=2989731 RepID=UPI0022217297|nr:hypothetical protein [Novosphingobium sp. JCM 18896]MCW1431366.1 hypothetical protein [Novosphingobium sp. JCM 18896]